MLDRVVENFEEESTGEDEEEDIKIAMIGKPKCWKIFSY